MKDRALLGTRAAFVSLLKRGVSRTLFACLYEETNRVALLLKRSVTNRSN